MSTIPDHLQYDLAGLPPDIPAPLARTIAQLRSQEFREQVIALLGRFYRRKVRSGWVPSEQISPVSNCLDH